MVNFFENTQNAERELTIALRRVKEEKNESVSLMKLYPEIKDKFGLGEPWVDQAIQRLINAKHVEKYWDANAGMLIEWIGK